MDDRNATGFYCSTSGTVFSDKESYLEHMKSDFHRYNLKRKVAGLPPVTKEWFEARRAQLATAGGPASGASSGQRVWVDPLTRKKFASENTWQAYTRSRKYAELVRKSGQPAPDAIIMTKSAERSATERLEQEPGQAHTSGAFSSKVGKGGKPRPAAAIPEDEDEDTEDGWETASDEDIVEALPANHDTAEADGDDTEEDVAPEQWEKWDVCRSLFDNHVSKDLESNLTYMFKHYGFYFPDAEYLQDPEGLLQYLGCKLQYGRVPLYTRGDDATAKQFRSLHAVQRHMVDTNQCRMAYEDNEDEYDEYYKYDDESLDTEGKELVVSDAPPSAMMTGGHELVLPSEHGTGGKILGTREFARYYKQRPRLEDSRGSVHVNTMLARYRSLGIATIDGTKSLEAKKQTSKTSKDLKWEGKRNIKTEVWSNFVKELGKGVGRMY